MEGVEAYGSGHGYGSGYWIATIVYQALRWTESQRKRLGELRAAGARIAFWRSGPNGEPANGGDGRALPAAAPGVVHEITGPIKLCSQALHATTEPPKWKGSRTWVVALVGEIVGEEDKLGALKREFIAEVPTP